VLPLDLRLELSHVVPPVWRRLRVPADLRLDDLHHAIQAVMGWEDLHPHVFEVGEHEYGPPPDPASTDGEDDDAGETGAWAGDDKDITVARALTDSPDGFTYIYDFAEEWRVRITVDVTAAPDAPPGAGAVVCLAGAHAGPQRESRELDPFTIEAANRRLIRALRPRATPAHPAGERASAEQQLLANLSLVVLLLGSRPTRHGTREAWKNIRTEVLDSLTEAGLLESDPQRKSVTITDAGVVHARRLLERLRSL
jgi:hypothetical protein